MSNQNAKEIIKAKLSIESVVGSYVKLEKSGKNFRACCPFHSEKTPSFYVTPDRGIFYCYGCQKGGDIFSFVQEIEGVSFYEALKSLADKAGVVLEKGSHEADTKISIQREIMEIATRYYEVGLRTEKSAVDYLLQRGLLKETLVDWRIGYAKKGWSGLYDTLKKKGYSDADIQKTGLCVPGNRGMYDRFRERIMFPIMDPQGRVIAFTGRVLPGTEEAGRPVGKYINSPETDLYHKSKVLFGFDKARTAIHANNFVILVEGQMDVMMSHQAGVTHTVALSGTASTDLHMDQIKRFTDNVAICLDADSAGLAAAQKTAMVAYAHDMRVLVIDITSGKDPADMVAENPEQWREAITHRKDIITFLLEKMKQNHKDDEKITIARRDLFPILAHIKSEILLDDRLKEIAHSFGSTSVDPVRKEFERFLTTYQRSDHESQSAPRSGQTHELEAATRDDQEDSIRDPGTVTASVGAISQRLNGMMQLMAGTAEEQEARTWFARYGGGEEFLFKEAEPLVLFQLEHAIGTVPDALPKYLRTFKDETVRYRMSVIANEKQQLDNQIRQSISEGKSMDEELLRRLHQLQVERDSLTRLLR